MFHSSYGFSVITIRASYTLEQQLEAIQAKEFGLIPTGRSRYQFRVMSGHKDLFVVCPVPVTFDICAHSFF